MRILKGILIVMILVPISCSKKGDYPVETEFIDGVQVIINPDYPRDGRYLIALEEELSIGESEEEGQYFSHPDAICVSDDGTIFIYDSSIGQVSCFDEDGHYLRSFANKGQGPGEFETLRFTLSQDNRIYAMDTVNARISVLDLEGNYIHSFNVLNLSGGWSRIYSDKNNNIYFATEKRIENGYVYGIHRYDQLGNELHDYGEFYGERFLSGTTSRSSISPATVWVVSDEGKLYAGYNDDYLIDTYDQESELLFKFGRKFDPLPDTKKWLEGISDHLPAYSRTWLMDDVGNLWIELISLNWPQDMTYDIFSPEGIYLKQYKIKYRILAINNKKVYCIIPSDTDLPLVKRCRMIENAN